MSRWLIVLGVVAVVGVVGVFIVLQLLDARAREPIAVRAATASAPATRISAKLENSPALTFWQHDPIASDEAQTIADDLPSTNASTRAATIEKIRRLMQAAPDSTPDALAKLWVEPLMSARCYQDVADWTLIATCCIPRSAIAMAEMETLLESRARALLALGRTRDALAAAKQLYNFARLPQTHHAADLLAECLKADPQGRALVESWLAEQNDPDAAEHATTQPAHTSVLSTIRVNPNPYQTMVHKIDEKAGHLGGMDLYRSYIQRGNRMLLADKPAEARRYFDEGLKLCDKRFPRWQSMMMAESIARCIRAEDGNLVRASQYLSRESQRIATRPSSHPFDQDSR